MKAAKNNNEGGFACIFVLMLVLALFVLASLATNVMYAAHRQNLADKEKVIQRAAALGRTP